MHALPLLTGAAVLATMFACLTYSRDGDRANSDKRLASASALRGDAALDELEGLARETAGAVTWNITAALAIVTTLAACALLCPHQGAQDAQGSDGRWRMPRTADAVLLFMLTLAVNDTAERWRSGHRTAPRVAEQMALIQTLRAEQKSKVTLLDARSTRQ